MEIAKAVATALFPAMALDAYKKYLVAKPKHRYVNALPEGEVFVLRIGEWNKPVEVHYDSSHNGEAVTIEYKGKTATLVPTTEEYIVTPAGVKVHGGGSVPFL